MIFQNVHLMKTRNPDKYIIKNENTDRRKRSAVPFLQRLLNDFSDFSVSPWSKFFYFPFLENFYSTWGPVGAWTWTTNWTRA